MEAQEFTGIYPENQQLTITVSFCRDRFRTMINVLGDALAAGIMAHICRKEFIKDGDEVTMLWARGHGGSRVCQGVQGIPGCARGFQGVPGGAELWQRTYELPHLVPPVYKRCFRDRTELGNGKLSTWGGGIFFHEVMESHWSSRQLCLAHWGWEQQKQLRCPANARDAGTESYTQHPGPAWPVICPARGVTSNRAGWQMSLTTSV